MAYMDMYWLAKDATFTARVQMAMVTAATQVSAEDPATEHHTQRVQWAQQVIRDPDFFGQRMAYGVASNPVITAESTDSDIQFTVNSIWDAYAGVTA